MTAEAEVAKQESTPATIKKMIEGDAFQDAIMKALPETGCTPDRFVRVALTILNKTPKLKDCTQSSVAQCMIDCASLGIEPDGRRAHLIPYGNKCTLILDYKGIVELVRRSGDVVGIQSAIVYQNDEFEYVLGTTPKLDHKPALADRGEAIAVYSCVSMKDGTASFEVMTIEEINFVRDNSKGYKAKDPEVPWNKWWGEMARKTVFKRHSKWLTLSPELHEAIQRDNDYEAGKTHDERAMAARPVMETAEELFSGNSAPTNEQT
jgi:recombination protein RecT